MTFDLDGDGIVDSSCTVTFVSQGHRSKFKVTTGKYSISAESELEKKPQT